LTCGEFDEIDAARIDDDQFRPPRRRRFFINEPNTGWPSVGFAPMTTIDVGLHHRVEGLRTGDSPSVCLETVAGRRMTDAGAGVDVVVARSRRARASGRDRFPRFVQRDDVMPPIEPGPCCAWMRLNSDAAWAMASSQLTSCHGSVIFLRIIGVVIRSLCVA
jgi:hypothetical protein